MGIIVGVGASGTISGANGGKTYAFNGITSTSNTLIAPASPSRTQITFVNPGASVTLYVSMVTQLSQSGIASPLSPTVSALGGALPVFPGAFVVISGECQTAWQALAASGGANPLTVIDTNV